MFASQDSSFDSSVCEATLKHAETVLSQLNPSFRVVREKHYSGQEISPGFYKGLVAEAAALHADALFVCDTEVRCTRWNWLHASIIEAHCKLVAALHADALFVK